MVLRTEAPALTHESIASRGYQQAARRQLKTSGLYRLVRHPLYASYLLSYLGYVLANTNLRNVLAKEVDPERKDDDQDEHAAKDGSHDPANKSTRALFVDSQ